MAQIPNFSDTTPKPPPGLNAQRSPYAPAPKPFNVQRSPYAPVVNKPQIVKPTLGSPSAVGFNPAYTPPVKKESAPLFPGQFPMQGGMGAATPLLNNKIKPDFKVNAPFVYTPPEPYNNPYTEYKAPKTGITDPASWITRPQTPFNPQSSQDTNLFGNTTNMYNVMRDYQFSQAIVQQLSNFIAENQGRYRQLKTTNPQQYADIMANQQKIFDMINRQKLHTGLPIVGDQAIDDVMAPFKKSDPVSFEFYKKSLTNPAEMRSAYVHQFEENPYAWRQHKTLPYPYNYPVSEQSVKTAGIHEAKHLMGLLDPRFEDEMINNYKDLIGSDPINRTAMMNRFYEGLKGKDYHADPREQLARRDQVRAYIKDVYGSDDFHKLTAEQAVRMWQEATGTKVGGERPNFSYLQYPFLDPSQNMTPEQTRLLLQNNFAFPRTR